MWKNKFIRVYFISFILAGLFIGVAHMTGWGWVLNEPLPKVRKGAVRVGGSYKGPFEIFVCCSTEISVRIVDGTAKPNPPKRGVPVKYDIISGPSDLGSFDRKDGGILSKTVKTNGKGHATIKYVAGDKPGIVKITASVMASGSNPSSGEVSITVKESGAECKSKRKIKEFIPAKGIATVRCDGNNGFVFDPETTYREDALDAKITETMNDLEIPSLSVDDRNRLINIFRQCTFEHETKHVEFFFAVASAGDIKNTCKGCGCDRVAAPICKAKCVESENVAYENTKQCCIRHVGTSLEPPAGTPAREIFIAWRGTIDYLLETQNYGECRKMTDVNCNE